MAICVPVRNEERALPALLCALASLDRRDADIVGCFYLDGCSDGSEALLRSAALKSSFPLVCRPGKPSPDANAGRARRAAFGLGQEHRPRFLLSTDADSCPAADWVQAALRALSIADFAAGRIVRSGGDADVIQCRLERYYDRLHAYRRSVDPVPWDSGAGCHHSGGANLAMRSDAYAAVGGFRPLPAGEDATLLDDAGRAGLRVRRDPAMLVHTSSRRQGRAPGGLAAALREIDAMGCPRVVHPNAAAWQYQAQRAARDTYAGVGSAAIRDVLGRRLGLSGDHVLGVARDCPNAEAFAMRIVPSPPERERLVSLDLAETVLADLDRARIEVAA